MRGRVKELHYEYCVPKPQHFITLIDTDKMDVPPLVEPEKSSIDINILLIV